MRKLGVFYNADGTRKYSVISYESAKGSRIDVINEMENYQATSTHDCVASMIITDKTVFYGDIELLETIRRVMSKSALYPAKDNIKPEVAGGAFIYTVSKESEDGAIAYVSKTTNGALSYERYLTEEGDLYFTQYDAYTAFELKPLNYVMYTEAFTEAQASHAKPTADGYDDFNTLWNKFPKKRHVLTNPKNDYVMITSYEQAVERLKTWIESKEQFKCIDVESLDKEWFPGSNNRITGVILGIDETWSTYFPFRQDVFKYNLPLEFLRQIFDAVNNQPDTVLILSHNGKFEIESFLQEYREILRIDIDTFVLSKLVFPDKYSDHSLKGLTEQLTGEEYLELKEIFKGKIRFNVLPEEIVKWYACPDVTNPVKIYKKLIKMLPEDEHRLFFAVETRCLKVKAFNEFYGMRLDQDDLREYLPKLEADAERLKTMFLDMHHTTRNINSSDTMMDILYHKLKITPTVFTSNNMPATSKTAISEAISAGYKLGPLNPDAEIPEDIKDHTGELLVSGKDLHDNRYPSLLIYQQYKLLAKKVIDLKRLVENCYEGFFHFYVNQLGADTGRQTSDAQQFSATMKKMAIPDTPFHHLCSCDYHQVELRLLFGEAGQKDLAKLAEDSGVDLHRAVASLIKKKPIYEISEEERQESKGINFGIVYMMSEYGMAARDCGPRYTQADLTERRNRITNFMNSFPAIKMFLEQNKMKIRTTGEISTSMGYHRFFPQVLKPDADESTIQAAIRSGNNTPIQGLCATILKMSEIMAFEEFERRGWLKEKDYGPYGMRPMARLVLPIHDEHLFVFDKEIPIEVICEIFRDCMEFPIEGIPPLYSSPSVLRNWLDAKDAAFEMDISLRDKCIENYHKGIITFGDRDFREVLKEHSRNEIKDYLAPLFAKYKTPEEVAKHVKHDTLTHTIIAIVDKKKRKHLTHEQRILEAVRQWYKENGNVDFEYEKNIEPESDDWGAVHEYYDSEGNLISESYGDVEDEDILQKVEEDKAAILDREYKRFVYTVTDLFVDLSAVTDDVARNVNKVMAEKHSDDNPYNVVYVRGGQVMRTNYFVPYDPEYALLITT